MKSETFVKKFFSLIKFLNQRKVPKADFFLKDIHPNNEIQIEKELKFKER